MPKTEKESPKVEQRGFCIINVRRRERLKENNMKRWREMERNGEKEIAMRLIICKSSVTLVSGFSGAAKLESTFEGNK